LTENGIIIRDVTNKIQWIAMLGIKGITASATKGEEFENTNVGPQNLLLVCAFLAITRGKAIELRRVVTLVWRRRVKYSI
jgi:hypothetical protein